MLPLQRLGGGAAECGTGSCSRRPHSPSSSLAAATTNANLKSLVASQIFANQAVEIVIVSPGKADGTPASITVGDPGSIVFAYDAPTQSYTITGATLSTAYGPADLQANASADPTALRYQHGPNDVLTTARSVGFGDTSVPWQELSYVGYGFWNWSSSTSPRNVFFVYGLPTDPAALPTTGSYTYRTDGDELSWEANVLSYRHGSFLDLSADFAAGTVTARIYSGNAPAPGFPKPLAGQGTGLIDRTKGSFSVTLSGGGWSGSLQGRFYGPGASEVGTAHAVRSASGAGVVGAMAGAKQ
ncbi:MAG: hypothetical protein JO013_08860 [Alphaproteobacteria bacterium]|nr:hypothetical protein [Alphaproteobacteria bacterium]